MTDNNMLLWDRVSKTNPKHTKPVPMRGGFTAIDPHTQVMDATEEFGPAGMGWGWEVMKIEYTVTNDIAILIGLWVDSTAYWKEHPILTDLSDHHQRGLGLTGPGIQQWGQASLYSDKQETRKDTDAFKKATTDGITKCLSYLGFNADVFLGKFDDVKYVQKMQQEFKAKDDRPIADKVIKKIEACKTVEEMNTVREEVMPDFKSVTDKAEKQRMSTTMQKKRDEFPDNQLNEGE